MKVRDRMAQRKVNYGVYDGKQVQLGGTSDFAAAQTVSSIGSHHNMGDLTIEQGVLSAGTFSDRVSVLVRGDVALVLYMTTGQYAAFETSVVPALSVIGNVAPRAFDLL